MQACISTSNRKSNFRPIATLAGALLALLLHVQSAHAKEDKTTQPEEDDFQQTPVTEYGEFNEDADEESDTRFFQFGRLFGVSVGTGYMGATGNRGILWQGGFPIVDARVHYWFDFNNALDLGIFSVNNFYDVPKDRGHTDVNTVFIGVNLKHYFDTKNLSAAISFANPYVLMGFGSYTKTETIQDELDESGNPTTEKDSTFGLGAGFGFEFPIVPRKSYLSLEAKMHYVHFKDTSSQIFNTAESGNLDGLGGVFYTFTVSGLFTW